MMTASYEEIDSIAYWNHAVIKYTLNANYFTGSYSEISNVNDGDAYIFALASALWSNITNISFEEDDQNAELGFFTSTIADTDAGKAYLDYGFILTPDIESADVFISSSTISNNYDYAKVAAIHEIGHALGLDHPEGLGFHSEYNQSMTIMSYNEFDVWGDNSLILSALTPMYFDVRMIQQKYGLNETYNSGNTTYTLNGSEGMYTIWDAGGNDTIDASGINTETGVGIDLRNDSEVVDGGESPDYLEHANYVGDSVFWLAYGAHIENVIGTDWDDYIVGSDSVAADGDYDSSTGNNSLVGGEGEDWIEGNGGDDTIDGGNGNDYLFGGDGDDFIYAGDGADYQVEGGAGNDFIDLGSGDDTIIISALDFDSTNLDTIDGGLGSDTIQINDTFDFDTNAVVLHIMDADNDLTLSYANLPLGGLDDGGHEDDFTFLMNDGDYTVMLTSHQSFSTNTSSYTATSLGGNDIINDDLMLVFGEKNSVYEGSGDINTLNDMLNWFDNFSVMVIHDVGLGLNYTGSDLFSYLTNLNWTMQLSGNSFIIHEPVV